MMSRFALNRDPILSAAVKSFFGRPTLDRCMDPFRSSSDAHAAVPILLNTSVDAHHYWLQQGLLGVCDLPADSARIAKSRGKLKSTNGIANFFRQVFHAPASTKVQLSRSQFRRDRDLILAIIRFYELNVTRYSIPSEADLLCLDFSVLEKSLQDVVLPLLKEVLLLELPEAAKMLERDRPAIRGARVAIYARKHGVTENVSAEIYLEVMSPESSRDPSQVLFCVPLAGIAIEYNVDERTSDVNASDVITYCVGVERLERTRNKRGHMPFRRIGAGNFKLMTDIEKEAHAML